jgi:uncharacterized membrane protein YbhN (UPF0104 family)
LFDLLALAGYSIVVSLWAANLFAPHLWNIIALGLLAALTLVILLVLKDRSGLVGKAFSPIGRRLPARFARPLTWYAGLFVKGLGVLGRGPLLSLVLLLTIAVWVTATLGTYFMRHAFHIDANLLITAILVVVLNLSFAFPLTPGNVGINQALSVFLLGTFGVPPVTALAYSISSQGARYLLIVSLGIVCFWREGLDFDLFRPTPKPEKFAEPSAQK